MSSDEYTSEHFECPESIRQAMLSVNWLIFNCFTLYCSQVMLVSCMSQRNDPEEIGQKYYNLHSYNKLTLYSSSSMLHVA